MKLNIIDGIKDIYNDLTNQRNILNKSRMTHNRVGYEELRAIYKSGLGSKIVRIKAGYALKDTILFESEKQEKFYKKYLEREIKKATRYMIGFGRGILVFYEKGEDLSRPRTKPFNPANFSVKCFSGDMVTAVSPDLNLMSDRYNKPLFYSVRGVQFHHSRVVDFTYYEPVELDAPYYQYGGISEFELIYEQLVNDSVIERACPSMLEKSSTLFYKIKDFKINMQAGQEKAQKEYFKQLEDRRSIYGAGLLDADDDAFTVSQVLTNLPEIDTIGLRRIAMVTGIPLAQLIGENVKGLNSTGENELKIFQDTIETIQADYLENPINQVFSFFEFPEISFKENQGGTPESRIEYETKALNNALILWQLGEDYKTYLNEKDVVTPDDFEEFFKSGNEEDTEILEEQQSMTLEELFNNGEKTS